MATEAEIAAAVKAMQASKAWPAVFAAGAARVLAEAALGAAERVRGSDAYREDLIEQCAQAAAMQDRVGYEWVKDSLWATLCKRSAAAVRKLKGRPA